MRSKPSHAIVFDHVSKRYKLGTQHDSLRDMIPALLSGWSKPRGAEPAGTFWALKDVTFDVRPGETLGIIGPNGAGKSTILKLLSRITKQTEGTMRVHGRMAALIELGGGFHPDLTGRENIFLQGTMLGLSHRQIRKLFDPIVAFSGLEAFLETPVKRYSSGMVVRLGFAVASQIQPEVLLVDEVLAVGDLAFQQKCLRRIRELKQLGTALIFISHDLNSVESICDRALLLNNGEVKLAGGVREVAHAYRQLILDRSKQQQLKENSFRKPKQNESTTLEVSVCGQDGAPLEQLQTGEPAVVRIRYRAQRPIADPVFQVRLERLDGILCHAVSTRDSGVATGPVHGEGEIVLSYHELNLLPNTYWVSATLSEGSDPVPVAAAHRAGYFVVGSTLPERGAVHLKHSWQVDELMTPAAVSNGA